MQADRHICVFGIETEYRVAASKFKPAALHRRQPPAQAIRALCEIDRVYTGVRPVGLFSLLSEAGNVRHTILRKRPNWSNSVLARPTGTRAVLRSRWIIAHQDPCRVPCDWTGFAHGEGCERLQIASTPLCAPTSLASAVSQ